MIYDLRLRCTIFDMVDGQNLLKTDVLRTVNPIDSFFQAKARRYDDI
jgi:hypothetical protein